MPVAWFDALENANRPGMFGDPANLAGYGFVLPPDDKNEPIESLTIYQDPLHNVGARNDVAALPSLLLKLRDSPRKLWSESLKASVKEKNGQNDFMD